MRRTGSDGKEQRATSFYKAPYVTPAQFAALVPVDGDECYLIADATNGVIWHFRYNAGSSSAYKWEFLGGPPLKANVGTSESAASGGPVDLATVGPSITLPRAGDYDVQFGFRGNSGQPYANIYSGSTTTILGSKVYPASVYNANFTTIQNVDRMLAVAASTVARMRYGANAAASSAYEDRWLSIWPVRIS